MPKHPQDHVIEIQLTVADAGNIITSLKNSIWRAESKAIENPKLKEIAEKYIKRANILRDKLIRSTLIDG